MSHEVVDYLLLLEHWLKADVDNTNIVFSRLQMSLVPGFFLLTTGRLVRYFEFVILKILTAFFGFQNTVALKGCFNTMFVCGTTMFFVECKGT